jgi:hypothetical protein
MPGVPDFHPVFLNHYLSFFSPAAAAFSETGLTMPYQG